MLETTELITVFHRDSAFKIGNFLAAVILEDKIGLSSFSKNLKCYIIYYMIEILNILLEYDYYN